MPHDPAIKRGIGQHRTRTRPPKHHACPVEVVEPEGVVRPQPGLRCRGRHHRCRRHPWLLCERGDSRRQELGPPALRGRPECPAVGLRVTQDLRDDRSDRVGRVAGDEVDEWRRLDEFVELGGPGVVVSLDDRHAQSGQRLLCAGCRELLDDRRRPEVLFIDEDHARLRRLRPPRGGGVVAANGTVSAKPAERIVIIAHTRSDEGFRLTAGDRADPR